MAAVAFNTAADLLDNAHRAGALLDALGQAVPIIRRHRPVESPWLQRTALREPQLEKLKQRDGRVQLGTLGRGNHFVEFQRDEEGRLWLMVHSGSRGMGQAIRDHYLTCATGSSAGLKYLNAHCELGRAYLRDMGWARAYAAVNRHCIIRCIEDMMQNMFGVAAITSTLIRCDHNHVQRERHFGEWLWVHRKGAMGARRRQVGIIPGSMGTHSFHVEGRGCAESMASSSHGAGRNLSRHQAMRRFDITELKRQMDGVWFDERAAARLRDEAPATYNDIDAVMRAQRDLVRPARRLIPVLVYKG